MKPQSAKAKGRKFQQWVRDKIYEYLGQKANLRPGDVDSRSMGAGGEDVVLSPKAREAFPYAVECKAHKTFAIYSIYAQSERHTTALKQPHGDASTYEAVQIEQMEPVVFIKQNNSKPLVVVDAEHFFELVASRYEAKRCKDEKKV